MDNHSYPTHIPHLASFTWLNTPTTDPLTHRHYSSLGEHTTYPINIPTNTLHLVNTLHTQQHITPLFTWWTHFVPPTTLHHSSLGKHEGNEVAQVHGLRGWPSPSVQVERLLVSVSIQDPLYVPVKMLTQHTITWVHTYRCEKKIPLRRKWCGFCFVAASIFCSSSSLILWLPNCPVIKR